MFQCISPFTICTLMTVLTESLYHFNLIAVSVVFYFDRSNTFPI